MIMININTADSLVNGALGSVIDIVTKDGIDSEKVGREQRKIHARIADKYKESNGTQISDIQTKD